MSRGLGKTQADILRFLWTYKGMARTRVLLSFLLGWPGRPGDAKVFDSSLIGKSAYNSGRASLSRSLRALQKRGIVEFYRNQTGYVSAVALTIAGVALARQLTEGVDGEPKLK